MDPLNINTNFDHSLTDDDDLPDLISDESDDDLPDLVSNDYISNNYIENNIICNDFDDDLPDLESENTLQQVKDEIEATVNFPSMDEGLNALDTPDILLSRMQTAFDQFKNKIGRNMTYSEMRSMMG